MSNVITVYAELHKILAPYAEKLDVKKHNESEFYVDTRHMQKNKKPLFFAAVQAKKSYVSFHLMPVYLQPDLLASVSAQLKARMQGKSCFNFTKPEQVPEAALGALVERSYGMLPPA